MKEKLPTEQESLHKDLDKLTVAELISGINAEDKKVAESVSLVLPQIEKLIEAALPKMQLGGRLFYIGAGTSGRLGILDASECPPTFGVPHGLVIGIIAGGDSAIRKAVEFAEDNRLQAWEDLKAYEINQNDVVVGITASGKTPYVLGGVSLCKENGILTGSISSNPQSEISAIADFPIEVITGPEFLTGSTRMKSGTAQKMVLNTITTTLMIKLGRVKGNKMVDMQLSNNKLWDRGIKMILETADVSPEQARRLLEEHGSVRKVLEYLKQY
jgi:N-acetylmuramic acid 6-phosphate etherase